MNRRERKAVDRAIELASRYPASPAQGWANVCAIREALEEITPKKRPLVPLWLVISAVLAFLYVGSIAGFLYLAEHLKDLTF